MIEGVFVKELNVLSDDRGWLMEILRSDDKIFKGFGQCYVTMCKKDTAKAWHYHKEQTDNFVCVSGKAMVVLCDFRKDSPTYKKTDRIMVEEPSENAKPILIQIPPMVAHGFTPIGSDGAVIMNIPTKPFNRKNPDEYRFPWNSEEIKFDWPKNVKKGG